MSVTYTQDELCDSPAATLGWVPPGMLHRGIMSGTTLGYFGGEVGGLIAEVD